MKCPYCKAPMVQQEQAFIVQLDDGQELRLEDVPTWICETCDHTEVEQAVIDAVEDMLEHMDTVAAGEDDEAENS